MLQGTDNHKDKTGSVEDASKSSISPTITITQSKSVSESDAALLSKAETTVAQLEIMHSPLIDTVVAHDPHAEKAKGIFLRTTSGRNLQVLQSVGTDEHELHGELAPSHQRVKDEEQGIWRVETLNEAIDRKKKNKI